MEDILTSDYAKQFINKIDKGELFIDDLNLLKESGFLNDSELYFELVEYCKERKQAKINQLHLDMQRNASEVADVLDEVLDDTMVHKIWKLAQRRINQKV